MYDYTVFIGRFQPFHKGHYKVVKHALEITKKKVIIVIGSHNEPRSSRNPFTTDERIEIIKAAFDGDKKSFSKLEFVKQENYTYNEDKWIAAIQGAVTHIAHSEWSPDPYKVGLIGYEKDHSSYYLKMFPMWETVDFDPDSKVDSTYIRNQFFTDWDMGTTLPCWAVCDAHFDIIRGFFNQKDVETVKQEYLFVRGYKEQWQDSPYPVTFNTVDALVIQSGHILVVERDAQPGKGQLALPGGFLNQHETLEQGMLRELKEETRIGVPKPVLKGSIVNERTFDDPWRSQRGRTITTCYHIRLRDDHKLPKIKGGDDARKAFWMPLEEFMRSRNLFFEDHYDIVTAMLGL